MKTIDCRINIKEFLAKEFPDKTFSQIQEELRYFSAKDLKNLMGDLGQKHTHKDVSLYVISEIFRYGFGLQNYDDMQTIVNKSTIR